MMDKTVRKGNREMWSCSYKVMCAWNGGGRGEGGVCVQREGERILLQIKSDLDESQVLKRALEAKIKDIGGFISKR